MTSNQSDDAFERLATSLRARRRLLDLSIEVLAERSGVSVNTIRNAEAGRPPTLRNIATLARALGCSVGQLLDDPGSDDAALPGWSRLDEAEQAAVARLVASIAAERDRHPLRRVAEQPAEFTTGRRAD